MKWGMFVKKVSLVLFAIIMSFNVLLAQEVKAASFPDVSQYEAEINYLTEKKVIQGFPDGTFGPRKPLTRLQAVQMLLRAKGITDFTAPNPGLTDMTEGKYGYEEVAKAVQLGIISGKTAQDGSKYFDPRNYLTRGQLAKVLVEADGLTINRNYSFPDVAPSNGFRDYISTMAAERITGGFEDGTYKPLQNVSREHFAVFTARMLDDKFKPTLVNGTGSYVLDKTKTYTWEYYDEGQTFTSQATHSNVAYEGSPNWDLWREDGAGGSGYFITLENDEGLFELTCHYIDGVYCGNASDGSYKALEYPLYVGKKWSASTDEYNDALHTVVSINRTVTTKAGTFKKVVEVTDSDGWTYFYARDVGLIQSLENGIVFAELIKLN